MATAPTPQPIGILPGEYLRRRREAEGLSIRQAARLYAYSLLGAPAAEAMLSEAESDIRVLGEGAIRRLAEHIHLDVGIYLRLADGLPPPDVCRACGCSWDCACDDGGQGCAWASPARDLCSVCARKGAA